jgi:CubicO group peptidase (beta-lactamase class C family)
VLFTLINISVGAQVTTPKIDSLISAYVSINKFNGSALIIQNGKKVYDKSYGYQNASSKRPNTNKSIFPIGSLTKSFTALVVLKLAEENKLSVNDPISRYLPSYPNGNEIQLRHLLTNTGGIYEKFRNPEFYGHVTSDNTYSNEEKIAFFKNEPLDFKPGTQFSYSNSGFDLLGIIIEKVTGSSYAEALRKYIFNPLKMKSSGFDFPGLRGKNKTSTYSFVSARKQVEIKPWNASLTFSSGGLYSSTEDLLKFYKGLMGYKIVSKKTFDQATTAFLNGYGYGWFIEAIHGNRVINHGGNVEGATSYLLMMPEQKTCIILLNNITSTSLENLGNSMYAALQNKPYHIPQPKKEIQLDEPTIRKYTGSFVVSKNYKIEVGQNAGRIIIKINNEEKIPMSAEKEGVFFTNDADIVLEFISKEDKIIKLKIRQGLSTKVADKAE